LQPKHSRFPGVSHPITDDARWLVGKPHACIRQYEMSTGDMDGFYRHADVRFQPDVPAGPLRHHMVKK